MATHDHNTRRAPAHPGAATGRRSLLAALAPAAAVLTTVGAAGAVQAHAASPDTILIRTCHEFAEAELTGWYRYITCGGASDAERAASDLWKLDRPTLAWIAGTPAATLEGFKAKALAFASLDRSIYDAEEPDTYTPILTSLLRDMVAPARAAIIARLVERFGPPPEGYAPDGMWVGSAKA